MEHELYSVWKNDGFNPKTPWSVQFPKGILSFKTKKKALAIANAFRNDENVDAFYSDVRKAREASK
jgi:hypothetical protein